MPASLIEPKNLLPDLDLNPGWRDPSVWLAGQQLDSPLTVLTDNVGSINKHAEMSIVKNNVNKKVKKLIRR